jgi:hypothetical protein
MVNVLHAFLLHSLLVLIHTMSIHILLLANLSVLLANFLFKAFIRITPIVQAQPNKSLYFDGPPSKNNDLGGYFLCSFWYKTHLPSNSFTSKIIGMFVIIFSLQLIGPDDLQDAGMVSRGRKTIIFLWFSKLFFNSIPCWPAELTRQ